MTCMICGHACAAYFTKTYTEPPFDEFMREIGPVHYSRCGHCGFVFSLTHGELGADAWNSLNLKFHHHLEGAAQSGGINQPPYAEQALMLAMLGRHGVIDVSSALDYAAGYGTLSVLLEDYFGMRISIFDPYVQGADVSRYEASPLPGAYRTVINSAMFEHVLKRADLDQVNALVHPEGSLVIHTVVCENVPANPDWFYLRPPVHTAFHTNKSMDILMAQWGYRSSVYCPPSKCWVLCRQDVSAIAPAVQALNKQLQAPWFIAKHGFVDYWKGF